MALPRDYLQDRAKGSTLYGFRGGPAGIMKCKYVELTSDYILSYRNQGGFDMIRSGRDKIETSEQFKEAEETVQKVDLDGLVVIGGDESNTNACLLADYFRFFKMRVMFADYFRFFKMRIISVSGNLFAAYAIFFCHKLHTYMIILSHFT